MQKMGIGILLSLAAIACQDSNLAPERPTIDRATAKALMARGFDPRTASDHGDFVLVEGDIMLLKSDLTFDRTSKARETDSLLRPIGPRLQWGTTSGVDTYKARQIRVNVAGLAADTGWQNSARRAMVSWSNILGVDISMTEGSPADITMQYGPCPQGCVAYASFPSGGNPGSTITIDTVYNWESSAMKKAFVTHELGHTIGFRHTDLVGNGESTSGAFQLAYTPSTDAASLMNHAIGFGNSVLSPRDTTAARDRFPATVQNVHVTGYPTALAWDAMPGASSYEVYYRYFEYTYDQDGTPSVLENILDLGATTGTTFYHGEGYTGDSSCDTEYYVVAVFPDGPVAIKGWSGAVPICP